jgi:hypothetical protein
MSADSSARRKTMRCAQDGSSLLLSTHLQELIKTLHGKTPQVNSLNLTSLKDTTRTGPENQSETDIDSSDNFTLAFTKLTKTVVHELTLCSTTSLRTTTFMKTFQRPSCLLIPSKSALYSRKWDPILLLSNHIFLRDLG